MHKLTKNEEILLLSVWRLKDNAYGVQIRDKIRETTKLDWNYGTLYCTLDQLFQKGYLKRMESDPVAERGGRRKIFYHLTAEGIEVLKEAMELQETLWKGINSIVLEGGKE